MARRRAASEEQKPVRARLHRWFPRAVVYREWRQHRWLYALAWFLLVVPAVGEPTLYVLLNLSGGHLTLYWALVSVVFGVLLMRLDLPGTAFALSGPAARRDVLRVKAAFGVMAVFLSFALPWLFSILGNVSNSGPFGEWRPGAATVGALVHALALSAVFLTGLAAACTVRKVLLATVGALLAAALPVWMAAVLTFSFSHYLIGSPEAVNSHWFYLLTTYLQQLSPMLASGFAYSGIDVGPFLLWYAAWGAGFWWLGARLWERVPVERLSETYFFPKVHKLVLGGIALVAALAVAGRLAGSRSGFEYLVIFAIAFISALWLVNRLSSWVTLRRAGEHP